MARILLALHNHLLYSTKKEGVLPVFYEAFIKGLRSAGNELMVFNHALSKFWASDIEDSVPKEIEEKIISYNPDLVILFNNSFYDITNIVDCPIVIYEVDSPMYYSNQSLIKKKPDRYKYCVAQTDSIRILEEEFKVKHKNIIHLPFFSEIYREKADIERNICFIGSKFTSVRYQKVAPYCELMMQNPNAEEILLWKKIWNEFENNPYTTKEEILEKYEITSEKILKCLEHVDWFCAYISDFKRIKTLSSIATLGLELYGTKNWVSDLYNEPNLTLCYNPKLIYTLEDNQRIYNTSKIGININHHQATTGFSWRVCDIMASNACLVSSYSADFKKLFPNIDIPTFTNEFEAYCLCKKLIENENYRLDIVAKCNEIIDEKYRFKHILKIMEDFLGQHLHEENAEYSPIIYTMTEQSDKSRIKKFKKYMKKHFKQMSNGIFLTLSNVPIIENCFTKKQKDKIYSSINKYKN